MHVLSIRCSIHIHVALEWIKVYQLLNTAGMIIIDLIDWLALLTQWTTLKFNITYSSFLPYIINPSKKSTMPLVGWRWGFIRQSQSYFWKNRCATKSLGYECDSMEEICFCHHKIYLPSKDLCIQPTSHTMWELMIPSVCLNWSKCIGIQTCNQWLKSERLNH